MTAGVLASTLPASVLSASINPNSKGDLIQRAYSNSTLPRDVSIVVSTLGDQSAITTITNNSNRVVTITKMNPGIVEHKDRRYDINAALGTAGITLKPGGTRMLLAKETKSVLA